MANVLIIHGSYGHPEENWFPWLKAELEKLGHKVLVPRLPTPEGQKMDIWLAELAKYDKYIDEDTVIVAHSMGCALVLRKLELLDKPIKAVFLVGGFIRDIWNGGYADIIDTFFEKPFDWEKIRSMARHFEFYQSDNDAEDVPISMGEEIAGNLNAELIIVHNAGHFNAAAGYTKFPLLLEKIKEVL
ncbi:serine hydrolase family protein [Candidatus Micrarchaeota archaeon]|nr:serine hydrolase family protein [Candidatus Micrarchaeota archaeon]